MDREHLQRIREIFEAALQVPPHERQAWAEQACRDDEVLAAEVSELLKAHEEPSPLLRTEAIPVMDLATREAGFAPGHVLGDRFEIVKLLGQGGMGQVYEASDQILHRTVALKILPSAQANDPLFGQRLRKEARALAALRHPNICAVYDVDRYGGQDVLVMECIEGETLASRLRRVGHMSLVEVVKIAVEICGALDYAHSRGLIHRDLKPANIMLTPEGIKLLDFGIARFMSADGIETRHITGAQRGDSGLTSTLTEHAGVVGTLQYMSPEQASGQPLDGRSDLFSLGVVVYEMATGAAPFAGDSPSELLRAVLHAIPATPRELNSEIPVALQDAICKCLAKSRHLRFKSAAELQSRLREIQSDPGFGGGEWAEIPYTPFNSTTKRWAAAAAVSLMIAVPIYGRFDLRSAIKAGVTRDDAVWWAREFSYKLRFPAASLREHVSFNPVVDLQAIGVADGHEATRKIVESGRAFGWEITLSRNGSPRYNPSTDPGVSVRLDCAGNLLEFQRAGTERPSVRDPKVAVSDAVQLIWEYLKVRPPGTPAAVDAQSVSWVLPLGIKGWQEQVRVQWSGDLLTSLSRRIAAEPGALPPGKEYSPIQMPLKQGGSIVMFELAAVVYLFGIWMLIQHRRSLRWTPSFVLAAWTAAWAAWLPFAMVAFGAGPPRAGSIALTALGTGLAAFVLTFPAKAGVYSWLRARHYRAVIGLEQLLRGRFFTRTAGSSLADGTLAGVAVAGIRLLQGSALSSLLHLPDLTSLTLAITADSPWLIANIGAGLAAVLVLGQVITFHASLRLLRKPWAAILTTAAIFTLLETDPGSPGVVIDATFGMAAASCYLLVYRTSGLAAALIACLTSWFVMTGIIFMQLGNERFMRHSLLMLEIPGLLLICAIAAPILARNRLSAART